MKTEDFRKYACEFVGTFILVFFAAGAVVVGGKLGALGPIGSGLISGLVLMAIIFAFGHVSGAHVNPALSIAAVYLRQLPPRLLGGYILFQMLGSLLGGLALKWVLGPDPTYGANLPNLALGIGPGTAFAIELFLSFVMMMVITGSVSAGPRVAEFAAIPIGGIVGIEVMLMGPVAGAAMNPARAFGPYVAMGNFTHYWIYMVGPVAGLLLGAAVFRFTHAGLPGAAPGAMTEPPLIDLKNDA